MKVAILTREDDKSPKVLAKSLKTMCEIIDVECDIIYDISMLIRMQPITEKRRFSIPFIKRLYSTCKYFRKIKVFIKELSAYDIIVISECTPNAFWRGYYAIEILRKHLKKPILLHEVYFLGNAPTQIKRLIEEKEPGIERYDWHFAVSEVTEIKSLPIKNWSRIGLNLEHAGLKPTIKQRFLVLVDFEQPGYELYRKEQIQILKEASIPYISLEGSYTMDEIRDLYRQACVLLIQFPEAFGLPIAECLASGAYIMTPSSAWPMSWRLDENPQVHSEGTLPDCFQVYDSSETFRSQLLNLKHMYDLKNTPERIFSTYIQHYPHYYYGNSHELKIALQRFS
jgi:hypothetical protein